MSDRPTPSPSPSNRLRFGGHARAVVAVGGDNNGNITNITSFEAAPPGPRHEMHVERRRPSCISDRLALWLNIVMTLTGIGSLALAAWQAYPRVTEGGIESLPLLPAQITALFSMAMAFLLAGLVVAVFRWWLRKRIYANWVVLGRVPEGRDDQHGRLRLHWTKLRGTCAIDGWPMVPARIASREDTLYMSDGSTRTKRGDFELRLVCTRAEHHKAHQCTIDPTSTEPR